MANEKDPIEDYVKELHDQFAQVHTDLGGIQKTAKKVSTEQIKATKAQTKAVEDQTKQAKQQAKEQAKSAKDQTSHAKTQSATLKQLQRELHREQMMKGATGADVAAEHLAGGGSIGGAMKAAAGLKYAQFTSRFDPLNIIKKMTGSKLATVMAGKIMRRDPDTVRRIADLAPAEEGGLPSSILGKKSSFGAPTRMDTGGGGGAERVGGGEGGLLGKIADTLTKVLSRVTGIEVILQAESKMSQDQLDAARDAAAESGAKKSPTRVGFVAKAKEVGGDMLKFIMDLLGKIKLGFVVAVMALIVAGAMLYAQWDKLKLSFSLLKDSAVDMWNSVKQAWSDAGDWISDTTNKIIDSVVNLFDSILEGIQNLLAKVPFLGYTAPTKEERRASKEERAKGGGMIGESTARTLAKQDAEAKATPEATGAVLAKLAPQFASKIPADGKVAAVETLKSGSLNVDAVGALTGKGQITGTPERVSTGAALSQLAGAAYRETYGVSPGSDTPENQKAKLPAMVEQASQALAGVVSATGPAQAPQTVTPAATGPSQVSQAPQTVTPAATGPAQVSQAPQTVTPATSGAPAMTTTAPTVGMDLNSAAEAKRNAEATGPAGIFAPMTNVNKTVNNNSATTINQGMAPTRSSEDTHVRARDMAYPRS